jgi:anti-sigma factor RsiW
VDNISDEVLMAFADGVLPDHEQARVAGRIAADAGLKARLQPFVVTRAELPALFAEAAGGPIPERLLKTVREAPLATARAKSRTSTSSPGLLSQVLQSVTDRLFPPGLGLIHAFTVAALLAGGAGAGWLAAKSSTGPRSPGTVQSQDVAFNDGLMFATGALAQALETAPSAPSDATAGIGSITPVLSFAANDHRFCRQYEMAPDAGKRFGGFACRNADGAWQVVFHSALAAPSPAANTTGYETAAGPGLAALESAIDKFGDGGRLERDQEAALIAKGWK